MLAKRAIDIIEGRRFYSTRQAVFISIRESKLFWFRWSANEKKSPSYQKLFSSKQMLRKEQIYDVHTNHLKLPTERKIASSLKQSNFNKLPFLRINLFFIFHQPFLFLSALRLFLSIECSNIFGVISLDFFLSFYIYFHTISQWAALKKLKSNISMALDKNKFRLNAWTKKTKRKRKIIWIQTPLYMSTCTHIHNSSGSMRKQI